MSFETIPEEWYDVGEAVKRRLLARTKSNLDDLESRINLVETGASKVQVANFPVVGSISQYHPRELKVSAFKSTNNFSLTEFSITLIDMGIDNASNRQYIESSEFGSLELDLKKSTDNGLTWESVCLVRPMILTADGSNINSNAPNGTVAFAEIDESKQNIAIDDMLRLEVISKKQRQGAFHILVYGELS